jgi:hypothetical protein
MRRQAPSGCDALNCGTVKSGSMSITADAGPSTRRSARAASVNEGMFNFAARRVPTDRDRIIQS